MLESELAVGSAHTAFNADDSLTNPELSARLRALLDDLLREIDARLAA